MRRGLANYETPTPFESQVLGLRVVAWGSVIGLTAFVVWFGWTLHQNRGR